ncbi:hypothetical protein BGZ61DRAFT_451634 [Ilyonectria robusta]|uniref:uncharacterized protein n=1 Tax=Ilyonectria robusta TaxID=1079257 RepID=UPI001E8D840F|nr:uncharacterized protein BGZ61DRAFT_451634 [Ilyonectria robusta]KAH8699941.1 hypothetical protein BGZ61DRAFT_451634 [Ilyonectria robusta]
MAIALVFAFRPSTIASLAVYRRLGPWASCYLVPAVGLRHRLHVPESRHWDHGVTIATHPKRSRKSSRERHVRDNLHMIPHVKIADRQSQPPESHHLFSTRTYSGQTSKAKATAYYGLDAGLPSTGP